MVRQGASPSSCTCSQVDDAVSLFSVAHLWTPIELQTELLPYLALSTVPLRNPGL